MSNSTFTAEDANLIARMLRANPSHIDDMVKMIKKIMDDADDTLRQADDHKALLKAQGARASLEKLVLHTYTALAPKDKRRKSEF